MNFDLVIYDLDGTLIDSKLDLAHSVNATRAHMGLPPLDHKVISSYVGNGAPVLMRRTLGPDASEEEVATALAFFLDYYREHKLDYTDLYPGLRHVVERVAAAGARQAVLTNKPVNISREIMRGLRLDHMFFQVYGGNSFSEKKPHPVGIETLLAEAGTDRGRALMVGDSGVDVQTARNAGVAACGVLWGFQPEAFEQNPPDFVVNSAEDLIQLVLNGSRA
jgi:phosphoglycolate phosphatase